MPDQGNRPNVLVVGAAHPWDVGYPFRAAFESLGCAAFLLDQDALYRVGLANRVLNRIRGKRTYFGTRKLNEAVLAEAAERRVGIVLFDNALFIAPGTVRALQKMGTKVFAWHNHDILDDRNMSPDFRAALPLFDWNFTTKSYQLDDFRAAGAKGASFAPFAADPALYHPEEVPDAEKKLIGADIVFVGSYSYFEPYRADLHDRLCRRGYDMKVRGNGWQTANVPCLRERGLVSGPAEGDAYRRTMNASRIALGLLAKHIPERHTHRTFEIPACGTFMLHERTPEAMSFFTEGAEAEFFGSFEELVEKIDHYLAHDDERRRIAAAGLERARSFEHSYGARAKLMLDVYDRLRHE